MPSIVGNMMISVFCLLYTMINIVVGSLFQILTRIGTKNNFINLSSVLRILGL